MLTTSTCVTRFYGHVTDPTFARDSAPNPDRFPKLPRELRFDKFQFQHLFDETLVERRGRYDGAGSFFQQMLFHIGVINPAGIAFASSRNHGQFDDRRQGARSRRLG